ncbi:MAG TPA: hypothetical protein VLD67_11860 [Vicinamibacterales bacterium]|nr:hypothetical protein [Vicinamibacterales bacterium]
MTRSVLLVVAVLALLGGSERTPGNDAARTFLATAFNVGRAEIGRIDAGQVFSRTLDVSHPREVATLGIVRIRTTPEFYVRRLTDIATFKQDDAVLQIGTFSIPPKLEDVADLTLEDADVRRLRACRVGNCDVQLSAGAIQRFRGDVTWGGADVGKQATSVMRQILVEYVTEYLEIGAPAAMEYADTPEPLNLNDELVSLMEADSTVWRYVPGLRRHLALYPAARRDGPIDVVYWSKERVNRRPVISITHLAIVPGGDGSLPEYAIASKQIYGMHYFDASLGLTLLVRDRAPSSPATYVVYLNRSRIDLFDGLFGGIVRKVVSGKARTLVSDQLARLRRTLEPQFAAAHTD